MGGARNARGRVRCRQILLSGLRRPGVVHVGGLGAGLRHGELGVDAETWTGAG